MDTSINLGKNGRLYFEDAEVCLGRRKIDTGDVQCNLKRGSGVWERMVGRRKLMSAISTKLTYNVSS